MIRIRHASHIDDMADNSLGISDLSLARLPSQKILDPFLQLLVDAPTFELKVGEWLEVKIHKHLFLDCRAGVKRV